MKCEEFHLNFKKIKEISKNPPLNKTIILLDKKSQKWIYYFLSEDRLLYDSEIFTSRILDKVISDIPEEYFTIHPENILLEKYKQRLQKLMFYKTLSMLMEKEKYNIDDLKQFILKEQIELELL